MSENSKIEWCDHTFNPWVGCERVSPGCDHCYAESWSRRTGNARLWAGERRRTSLANWRLPEKWNRRAEVEHNAWQSGLELFDLMPPRITREALAVECMREFDAGGFFSAKGWKEIVAHVIEAVKSGRVE